MILGLGGGGERKRPALSEPAAGRVLGHAALADAVHAQSGRLAGGGVAMVAAAPSIDRVVAWLAAMAAGVAVMPLPPDLVPHRLADLVRRYRPEWLLGFPPPEGEPYLPAPDVGGWRRRDESPAPHPDCALLLSTSGSTGSPRMVRLSRRAVEANAAAIGQALRLDPEECAPTSLPLSYSYGLSVLNSHLAVGAEVMLTGDSVLGRPFWQAAAERSVTSLAGVPFTYQCLRRLDLGRVAPPSLTTLTQAGGRLAPEHIAHFHGVARARGGRMYVMYGQTEATARMAVLPPEELPQRLGSVGRAVPGGAFAIEDGRVVYRGDNVMMGYADDRDDLARGDDMGGRLDTGDLGRLDADGFLWLAGRTGRLAKVMGLRLNLDEVEARAAALGGAAVVAGDDRLVVFVEAGETPSQPTRAAFAADLGLPPAGLAWRAVAVLPRTGSGKIDYPALASLGEAAR